MAGTPGLPPSDGFTLVAGEGIWPWTKVPRRVPPVTTTHADTMTLLLARGAETAPAIAAPGRPALTHGGLRALAAAPWRR